MLLNLDYDGVIVDSFDHLLDLVVRAQVVLGHGRPPHPEDLRTLEDLSFKGLGRCIGLPEDQLAPFQASVFELQEEEWDVALFPGMAAVLAELATLHSLVVITSSQGDAVAATLENHGLGSVISEVLGGDLGSSKAERIEQSRRAYGFAARDTVMIGDAVSDIRQGKRAGVKTAAVTWGYQPRALLAREQPDFMVDHPGALHHLHGA